MNESVFDALLEGIVIFTTDKRIRYCNEAFANLCEVPWKRIGKGKELDQFLVFEEGFWQHLPPPRELTEATPHREVRFHTKSGKEGYVQASLHSFKPAETTESGYILFLRDVTLEESLQKKYRGELAQKERVIQQLDRKVFDLMFLLGVFEAVNTCATADALLDTVLGKVIATFKFRAAGMLFLSDSPGTPTFQWQAIRAHNSTDAKILKDKGASLSVTGNGPLAASLQSGLVQVGTEADLGEIVAVPLKGKNADRGVIILMKGPDTAPLISSDLDLLIAMGVQVAMNLENTELYHKSITDEMTKLFNKRYFQYRLSNEIKRSGRTKAAFGLLVLDVDHFKKFNDTYGHQVGDLVLIQVAKAMKSVCRTTDIPARYGGEEFVMILMDTDAEGTVLVAERVRLAIESMEVKTENFGILKVTVSVGASLYPVCGSIETDLIEVADKALYRAKSAGRNNCQKGWD